MSRLSADTLPTHIEHHKERRGLKVGWDAFCAMDDAGASTSSMARTFGVEWRIMDKWRALRKQRVEVKK